MIQQKKRKMSAKGVGSNRGGHNRNWDKHSMFKAIFIRE